MEGRNKKVLQENGMVDRKISLYLNVSQPVGDEPWKGLCKELEGYFWRSVELKKGKPKVEEMNRSSRRQACKRRECARVGGNWRAMPGQVGQLVESSLQTEKEKLVKKK